MQRALQPLEDLGERPLRGAPAAASSCSTGFASSRYQSQKSYQVNSYSALAA